MISHRIATLAFFLIALLAAQGAVSGEVSLDGPAYVVKLPEGAATEPLQGRLMLLLSKDPSGEPRNQINIGPNTQIVFGTNVKDWKPGTTQKMPASADGYPVPRLADVAPGEYTVQ